MSAMSGALVGKREVKGHTQYLDERADVEDDGRMVVCEACCNNTSCNNGGSCGVEGTYNINGLKQSILEVFFLFLHNKKVLIT